MSVGVFFSNFPYLKKSFCGFLMLDSLVMLGNKISKAFERIAIIFIVNKSSKIYQKYEKNGSDSKFQKLGWNSSNSLKVKNYPH